MNVSKRQLSLLDLPPELAIKLCESVDFISLQALRKTTSTYRQLIDESVPEVNFDLIRINVRANFINIQIESDDRDIPHTATYVYQTGGCDVRRWFVEKFLLGEDFVERATKDLFTMLRHHNGLLQNLIINVDFNNKNAWITRPTCIRFLEILGNYLQNRITPLRVHTFCCYAPNQDLILMILPYIDQTSCRKLSISRWRDDQRIRRLRRMKINKILELDFTDRLTELCIPDIVYTKNIYKICVFRRLITTVERITWREIYAVARAYSELNDFEFHIFHVSKEINYDEPPLLFFGYPAQIYGQIFTWVFLVQDPRYRVMKIVLNVPESVITIKKEVYHPVLYMNMDFNAFLGRDYELV